MILRVFPSRTNATPTDDYALSPSKINRWSAYPSPLGMDPPGVTEVHVSVTFSWDLPEAERLRSAWAERGYPVLLGGPAVGMRGEEFTPGRYLKPGYVITSRGCPNNCWFCSVPKREGREIRELPIANGWNVLDDNLLACSQEHIRRVFEMLRRQKERIYFTGGMEAKRLQLWHVELFKSVRPKEIFFAYDTPDDWEPLAEACRMFFHARYGSRNIVRSYVLVGYPGDTIKDADWRCRRVQALSVTPMAMPYQNPQWTLEQVEEQRRKWRKFTSAWSRPAAIWALDRDFSYLREVV